MATTAVTESCMCLEMFMLPEGLIAPAQGCSSAGKEHWPIRSSGHHLAGAAPFKTEVAIKNNDSLLQSKHVC